jgi:hypothetical protein
MATTGIASTSTIDESGGSASTGPGGPKKAAATATAQNSIHLDVPGIAHIELPPAEQLAFLGGIATLLVLEIIEWPVAAVLAVGHVLAHNRHHALLRDFGEALDEA